MEKVISYQIRVQEGYIIKKVKATHPFYAMVYFVYGYTGARHSGASFFDIVMKNYHILTLFYVQAPGKNGARYDMEEMTMEVLQRIAKESGNDGDKEALAAFLKARADFYESTPGVILDAILKKAASEMV